MIVTYVPDDKCNQTLDTLSVGAIHFEDRLCVNRKGGIERGGCHCSGSSDY